MRGCSALLLLLEAIYRIYAENVSVTAEGTTFKDTTFRVLKNNSLERYPRICFLGATKARMVCSDTVRHGFRGHPS